MAVIVIPFLVGMDCWGDLAHFVLGDCISLAVETARVAFAAGLLRVAANPVLLVWARRRSGLMATWGQHIIDAVFIFDGAASLLVVSCPFDFV